MRTHCLYTQFRHTSPLCSVSAIPLFIIPSCSDTSVIPPFSQTGFVTFCSHCHLSFSLSWSEFTGISLLTARHLLSRLVSGSGASSPLSEFHCQIPYTALSSIFPCQDSDSSWQLFSIWQHDILPHRINNWHPALLLFILLSASIALCARPDRSQVLWYTVLGQSYASPKQQRYLWECSNPLPPHWALMWHFTS